LIDIPAYEPLDAKNAILIHPQPLPWVVAIVVELLPLLFLGLMLALWRDPEDIRTRSARGQKVSATIGRPRQIAGNRRVGSVRSRPVGGAPKTSYVKG
jgi:hypothetical protein